MKLNSLYLLIFGTFFICRLPASGQELNLNKYKACEQSITKIRIASAAILPEKWQKEKNWQRIEKVVSKAALEGGARVVVTPEGVLEGYVINEVNAAKGKKNYQEVLNRFKKLAEPINGPYIRKACALAKELGIYLVLGFLEQNKELLYNSAILIDPAGDIIGKYNKTHFAQGYEKNPNFYKPGDTYPVFYTPFGKVGILICYDRQLPEPCRIIALKGAQILFLPSYGSYTPPDGWNSVLLRTRAYENRLPIVFCNPFQSLLIERNGEIKAIGNAAEIVYYEVDTSPKKYEGRFRNRRPKTYSIVN